MKKADQYREALRKLDDWEGFLLDESGLPGPRANLELAHVVAEEGDQDLFGRFLTLDPEQAPVDSPYEFLAFCGVLGLGKMLSQGQAEVLELLRRHASDPRWRIREAVAQALQYLGNKDMDLLLQEMATWSEGDPLEQRAAAAALCEPRILGNPAHVEQVLAILDRITGLMLTMENRRSDEFRALRKGMAYCWSVAVAAHPEAGKEAMEKWLDSDDRDVQWVMKQNLRKKRLERMDADWVAHWKARLEI